MALDQHVKCRIQSEEAGRDDDARTANRRKYALGAPFLPGIRRSTAFVLDVHRMVRPQIAVGRRGKRCLDPARLPQNLVALALAQHDLLELRIVQCVRQPRQNLQMASHRGADEREERVHGLAVERTEVDGMVQKAHGHHRARDMENDRVSNVRQCDAVTDCRTCRCFPGEEEPQQQLAVDGLRKRQHLDQGRQCSLLAWSPSCDGKSRPFSMASTRLELGSSSGSSWSNASTQTLSRLAVAHSRSSTRLKWNRPPT